MALASNADPVRNFEYVGVQENWTWRMVSKVQRLVIGEETDIKTTSLSSWALISILRRMKNANLIVEDLFHQI